MLYDIKLSPEALKAASEWAVTSFDIGEAPTDVALLVDDRMLIAYQGDERMAWDTDGSPASDEYLAVCPLDRGEHQ